MKSSLFGNLLRKPVRQHLRARALGLIGAVFVAVGSWAVTTPHTWALASYTVPATFATDCSVDVTSALESWVGSLPDNSIILFPANACYEIDGTLEFYGRNGLDVEGNGSSFEAKTVGGADRSVWRFIGGSAITVHAMNIVGADSAGGTATAFNSSLQWQAGIDLRGVSGATIYGNTTQYVYGDCVYVGVGYDNLTWSTNIYVHDNICTRNGRSGISVTAGAGVNLDHNTTTQPGLWGVDVEPNGGSTGATNVKVTNSTFGPGGHLEPFVQVVGNSGGGTVDGITITGNTVRGETLATQFVPASGQRWSNITFSNNTSDTAGYFFNNDACAVGLVVVNVCDIDGITISNNYQPGPSTDEDLIYAGASCNVIQSGNQFPSGGAIAVIEPYSCPTTSPSPTASPSPSPSPTPTATPPASTTACTIQTSIFSGLLQAGQNVSYTITAACTTLQATLQWNGRADLTLFVYDGSGVLLGQSTTSSPATVTCSVTAGSQYRLVVADTNRRASLTLSTKA